MIGCGGDGSGAKAFAGAAAVTAASINRSQNDWFNTYGRMAQPQPYYPQPVLQQRPQSWQITPKPFGQPGWNVQPQGYGF